MDDGPISGGAEEAACALRDQKASSLNRNTFRTLLIPEVEPSLMTNQETAGGGGADEGESAQWKGLSGMI